VGNVAKVYGAYTTKAIAFDNNVETLSGGKTTKTTYKLPEGGQLVIDNGKIKIGDNYISPNYDCSGEIPVSQARP
jgi:maltoporin